MAVQETKDYKAIAERIIDLPMGVSEMVFDATVVLVLRIYLKYLAQSID